MPPKIRRERIHFSADAPGGVLTREVTGFMRKAFVRRLGEGTFLGGSRKLPVRSVSAVARSTKNEPRQPESPSYASQKSPARTLAIHAGGNSASASGGHAGEAACCRRTPFRRSRSRCAFSGGGDKIDPEARIGSQNGQRAPAPRRREFRERFGGRPREAEGCLRKAFLR